MAAATKTTLANLSALPPDAIAALRVILKGGKLVEASADRFAVERSLPCGHIRAIHAAMERLGMAELISSKPCPQRDAILAMIAQRIVRPESKLETAALFADTTLAADFNVWRKHFERSKGWTCVRVPSINHRLEDRVRAHFLLCMLAYYVEWHMRIALAPLSRVGRTVACAQ